MYPSKIMGPNVTLAHLKPTLKNATILCRLVRDNALYLCSVFDCMVQAYETPKETLSCLQYDEACRLRYEMLPYYILKNDEILGEITAEWTDKNRTTEMIYWIDEKHSGKGYVSESLKLMEEILFNRGHNQICLYINKANLRSAEVAKHNGYQLSDNADYYYKTWQMYCEQTKHMCCHKTGMSRFFNSFFGRFR